MHLCLSHILSVAFANAILLCICLLHLPSKKKKKKLFRNHPFLKLCFEQFMGASVAARCPCMVIFSLAIFPRAKINLLSSTNLQHISSKVNLISLLITTDLIWFSAAGATQLNSSILCPREQIFVLCGLSECLHHIQFKYKRNHKTYTEEEFYSVLIQSIQNSSYSTCDWGWNQSAS